MPKSRMPYPPEFRRKIVELVESGRTPEDLAREYEPSAESIRNWVKQAERDAGECLDGLTTDERDELNRLRREVRQLKEEREILEEPQRGSLGRPGRCPGSLRVREGEPRELRRENDVSGAGRDGERLLRLASPAAVGTAARRCLAD